MLVEPWFMRDALLSHASPVARKCNRWTEFQSMKLASRNVASVWVAGYGVKALRRFISERARSDRHW
jgi:hypothetical protein